MASIRLSCVLNTAVKRKLASFHLVRKLSSKVPDSAGQWQLYSAVCLQRPPLVTAERTPMEQQYGDLMAQLELESSILSDHELHAIEDRAVAEKRKQAEESEEGEVGARVTALDLEDAWEAEAKLFSPASRVTEHDTADNRHSTERALDTGLVLLVKQTLGDRQVWVLPQGPRLHGESMRQAAERVLENQCGSGVTAQFLGNAPCGVYSYALPPSHTAAGVKVFFFKAWYQEGAVVPNNSDGTTDYQWVTKDQLPNYCSKAYLSSLKKFLIAL